MYMNLIYAILFSALKIQLSLQNFKSEYRMFKKIFMLARNYLQSVEIKKN